MSNNRQLNYVNNIANRELKQYYIDNSELNLVPQDENSQVYSINDNQLYQLEYMDEDITYTGNVINFYGHSRTNIDNCEVELKPIQNLNGYDEPWMIESGKNILKFNSNNVAKCTCSGTADNYTITITESGNAIFYYDIPLDYVGQTLYLSGIITRTGTHANNIAVQLYKGNYVTVAEYTDNNLVLNDFAFTIPSSTASYLRLRIIASASADNSVGETMVVQNLRLSKEQNQPWYPSENICNIAGHTNVQIIQTNKNYISLNDFDNISSGVTLNISNNSAQFIADGYTRYQSAVISSSKQKYTAGTYYLKFSINSDAQLPKGRMFIGLRNVRNSTFGSGALIELISGITEYNGSITCTEDCYFSITIYSSLSDGTNSCNITFSNLTLSQNNNFYPISLNQTVYGGNINITTGELIINKALCTIDENSNVTTVGSYVTDYTEFWIYLGENFDTYPVDKVICNKIQREPIDLIRTTSKISFSSSNNYHQSIVFKMPTFLVGSESASILSYLQSNPIQVVAPLATPTVIQLTPQQINTLLGQNYLFSDKDNIKVEIKTQGLDVYPLAPTY